MKICKWLLVGAVVVGQCGCAVVYAPRAERLSLYEHGQTADIMAIQQDIQPRMANDVTGAVGASFEGNSVLSPSVSNSGNTKLK